MSRDRLGLHVLGGLLLATAAWLFTRGSQAEVFYVTTDGNEEWSGRLAAPNAQHADGPLASLAGARDAIRRARAAGKISGPVTVQVRGGRYFLDTPLLLEPIDSGTAAAEVVIEAYPKERPVLSGGRVIRGFREKGHMWEADVPEVKAGDWYFRQLFVDGRRRQRARGPNTGYYRIARLLPGPKDARSKAIARDKFAFAPGDLQPWSRLEEVNLILMHSWETSIHPLRSVDTQSNIVALAAPLKEWWCLGYWEKAQRYYVENAYELLDRPGEWYLNRETGVLSYWPMPGEKLDETEVIAPRLTELVRLAGDADAGLHVDHVTIRGLAFQHADWILAPRGNSSTQAAVEVPAVIMADAARHCAIEGCEVAHVGTYAIWFRRGCKDCRIQRNRLFDLGAGGVRVGEANMAKTDAAETSRTLVDNNHIFDGGRVYPAGIGIWVAQSSHNRISHNDLHDLLYSGISVGWNWNDAENRTHHNVVEQNHVHHLVHGVLSDAGLIYCLGVSPGSVIRNNVFHDIWPYSTPPFGWGIYLDATCGGYLVENNLVYNTQSGGLMFNNGGHEHTIRNNVFALSATHALWPYSEKRPSTLRRNIVYLTQGELLIPHGERSLNERLATKEPLGAWDENVYWHTGGTDRLRFYRHSFAEWQSLGLDRGSRIADPLFVDAGSGDFRLKPESPALELGFRPIDVSRVGLYGDPAWVREASHAKCRMLPLPAPPPPPEPLQVNDGFEKTAVGSHPADAEVSGEESGDSQWQQPVPQQCPHLYCWTDTCNVYVIKDGESAILIDLGDGTVLSHLGEIGVTKVDWVLFTHHHREQCQGFPRLRDGSVKTAAPATEQALFERPGAFRRMKPSLADPFTVYGASYVRPPVEPISIDRPFQAKDTFAWRGYRLRCLETPGNSPGSMTYWLDVGDQSLAFSGDVMLNGARMHTWFDTEWDYGFAQGLKTLIASVDRLAEESPVRLLPSHGPIVADPKTQLADYGRKLRELAALYVRGYPVHHLKDKQRDPLSQPTAVPEIFQVTPHLYKFSRQALGYYGRESVPRTTPHVGPLSPTGRRDPRDRPG